MTMLETRIIHNLNYLVRQVLDAGYKRYEVAAMMGLSPTQLSRWLHGKGQPTNASIDRIVHWYAEFAAAETLAPIGFGDFFGRDL